LTLVLAAAGNGKELWYLTRGSGAVALLLLTASVVLGVANTTRWKTDRWPRFIVYGLHRNVTLLALAFTVIHVVTTIVDAFAPIGVVDAFIPFLSPYRPFWLGLGTVAFDLLLALIVTSFLRRRIGTHAWRAVHWLAYASWPVAMLHSLGTGSDANTGWLLFLGVACGLSVLAAVLWRLLAARDAPPAMRAGATLGTIAVVVGLSVWARGGPLEPGWAARAGTPASLLRRASPSRPATIAARTRRAAQTRPSPSSALPSGSFTGALRGRIGQSSTDRGLVVVTIDGTSAGSFHGRVHLALRGLPVEGGGVQMVDSVVGLLPTGASAWSSGSVVGLAGTRVVGDLADPGGRRYRVRLDLAIKGAGRVTGTLHGRPLR
jgi:DMSO/TMAO reductase YedYZ heme-binding membrane subunit